MAISDLTPAVRPALLRRAATATASPVAGRVRPLLAGFGPAVVAAIAYVDPGNFATNVSAGSRKGYLLVWVVVAANLIAVLVQSLSAKLGLATGKSLPALCREQLRPAVARGLWLQAEAVTVATDLAEVVGGAVALHLLFGLPLVQGALVTSVVAFGLMALQSRGAGRFELVVGGLFAVILLGFLVNLLGARPDAGGLATGMVPRLDGADSLLLAIGILGATVMPHAVYLHSALTASTVPGLSAAPLPGRDLRSELRRHRTGIAVALGLAGLVNLSMLAVAASLFHGGAGSVETLEGAYAGLGAALGPSAALLFALALLASGFASTGVGTFAGQVVMSGFLRRQVPPVVRRAASLVPATALLVAGVDPTQALVVSQVVLAFGIPFALVPLVLFTSRRDLMGALVNRTDTTATAWVCAGLVIGLNAVLVIRLFSGG
jgi:manganese transport protein